MSSGDASESERTVELGKEKTYRPTVDEIGDHGAHVIDVQQLGAEAGNFKTTSDGRTLLIPQPSDNPHDPLNWSPLKKYITLGVVAVVAFMPDFGSSMGIVTLLPQAT
jgi:hypothetical protein